MSDQKHSPLPWSYKEDCKGHSRNEILDANGSSITDDETYYPSAPCDYDMAFIVEAVNFYGAYLADKAKHDTKPENMADWTTISPSATEEEIAAMVIGRAS